MHITVYRKKIPILLDFRIRYAKYDYGVNFPEGQFSRGSNFQGVNFPLYKFPIF